MRTGRRRTILGMFGASVLLLAGGPGRAGPVSDIHSIRHVIVIMQENRSFDSYFGTYPGADGLPRDEHGAFTSCVPDPHAGRCRRPYHDPSDKNAGGSHSANDARADIDGGKMDGFIAQAEPACHKAASAVTCPLEPASPDVMGYHDRRELPVYWSYADRYVLQDRMFEPNLGWSLPSHLFMVSGWSATCTNPTDPMTCHSDLGHYGQAPSGEHDYAWTDLTYLLHESHISWRYYVKAGFEPDCADDAMTCEPRKQAAQTPSIWNPLPDFKTVNDDGQLPYVQDVSNFYRAAEEGRLPAVSWVVPSQAQSEHPPALVSTGQKYVRSLVDAVVNGPDWGSSAIFISWDDWGGFYDHVVPPHVDGNGYGIRVPGLLISPFAKRGYIDHQTLSFDSYLRFIEDVFLDGLRIDPRTDGRPDPRPTVRERLRQAGDLRREFDFGEGARTG